MWIRLLTAQRVMCKGQLKTYHPGDWVDVGRQTAEFWISKGWADRPGADKAAHRLGQTDSGVVVVAPHMCGVGQAAGPGAVFAFQEAYPALGCVIGAPQLPFAHTAIWQPSLRLRLELLPIGLSLLDTWQLVIPLWDYAQLACHVGSAEEQVKTKAIVHDLRVPLYDTRLVFARRDSETEQLFDLWQGEVQAGADDKHAFLRAFYKVKPFICPLPTTWTMADAPR
jgi:hypothetical protein